ncbi:MAG: hypothetical protein Q7R99_02080 [bacterium]|nr:hypothetical protein [bacterium]
MNEATINKNKSLTNLIRQTVLEIIQEILADPDYGLALNGNFEKRLEKSIQSQKAGKVVSFDKILKKYSKK